MRVDWVGGFWGTLSGAVVSETDDVGCLHCFFTFLIDGIQPIFVRELMKRLLVLFVVFVCR